MKKNIKRMLAKLFHPLAVKLGYVNKNSSFDQQKKLFERDFLLYNFYDLLKKMNFNPKHIVDVGANHGSWTRQALKQFPDAHFTLLEPQEWLTPSFQDLLDNNPKIKLHNVGAGEKEGSFMFTILDRDDSCSFRYSEEDAKKAGFEQVEIPVVTLNGLLKNSDKPVPDIIKIDAEGLDIEVVRGASDFFGKTEIFMVEAGVGNQLFENSLQKLVNFMDECGYRLFEITDMNRAFAPGVLWLVELAFVRKGGVLDSYVIEHKL
jgi:FkbM family methyltransferase